MPSRAFDCRGIKNYFAYIAARAKPVRSGYCRTGKKPRRNASHREHGVSCKSLKASHLRNLRGRIVLLPEDSVARKDAAGILVIGVLALTLPVQVVDNGIIAVANLVAGTPHPEAKVALRLVEKKIVVETAR